ncbi:MAG: hypothetical protein ACRDMZ_10710, partial [Solirubrobacteraceae bacterium]
MESPGGSAVLLGSRVFARCWIAPCALILLCLFGARTAFALGTPAGTAIANTATVTYDIGASSFTQSVTAQFTVDERVDVVLT